MLYDNSLLAYSYVKAYSITGSEKLAEIACCTLDYINRVLRSPDGGFCSAEDADSEGVEGKFYVWSKDEVNNILNNDAGEFCKLYNITDKGNFEGKNIPNLIGTNIPPDKEKWSRACIDKLFKHREKRVHPFKDDKVLTSWNGLAIAAFAYAGRILQRDDYILSAKNAVSFIENKLTDKDHRLLSRYRDGESRYTAHAEDYSFYIWGLIELYKTTLEAQYLDAAKRLSDIFISEFWDDKDGAFFFINKFANELMTNPKPIYDGAMPSANSVAAYNILRLGTITGEETYYQYSNMIFKAFSSEASNNPAALGFLMLAALYKTSDKIKIIISAKKPDHAFNFLNVIPEDAEIMLFTESNNKDIPVSYKMINNMPTAFLCQNNRCHPPVTTADELRQLLKTNLN